MFQGLEIWGKNFCDFQILRRDVWEPWTTDSSISSQLLKSRNTITADTYEPKLHVMKHLHESHHHSVDECNIGQLLPVLSPSNASCVSNATKNTLMFNHTARVTGSTEVMLMLTTLHELPAAQRSCSPHCTSYRQHRGHAQLSVLTVMDSAASGTQGTCTHHTFFGWGTSSGWPL